MCQKPITYQSGKHETETRANELELKIGWKWIISFLLLLSFPFFCLE